MAAATTTYRTGVYYLVRVKQGGCTSSATGVFAGITTTMKTRKSIRDDARNGLIKTYNTKYPLASLEVLLGETIRQKVGNQKEEIGKYEASFISYADSAVGYSDTVTISSSSSELTSPSTIGKVAESIGQSTASGTILVTGITPL